MAAMPVVATTAAVVLDKFMVPITIARIPPAANSHALVGIV
jgi:hypothetical protein